MKRIIQSIIFLFTCVTFVFAQAPQEIQYQAIARDNMGLPIISQAISVQFSIIQTSATGSIVYVETHNATTNAFGLFNLRLEVQSITVISHQFLGGNHHYLKVELDRGGSSFQIWEHLN